MPPPLSAPLLKMLWIQDTVLKNRERYSITSIVLKLVDACQQNYAHVLMNSMPWFHGFSFITLINVPLCHNTDNSASCLLILSYPFLVFPSTQINVLGPRAARWAMKYAWLIEKPKEIKTIRLLNQWSQKVMQRYMQQCWGKNRVDTTCFKVKVKAEYLCPNNSTLQHITDYNTGHSTPIVTDRIGHGC